MHGDCMHAVITQQMGGMITQIQGYTSMHADRSSKCKLSTYN